MESIEPFHVMSLLGKAKTLEQQGRDIIHLEVGEPDFKTPQPIIDAGIEALRQGDIHYTPSLGLMTLRQSIAEFYMTRYRRVVPPSRVVVTPGASGALLLIMGSLIGHGDAVMLADPGYPCNQNFVRFVGGEIQQVAVDDSSQYQLTAELIEQNWQKNTKAVLIASPSNPTGTVVPTPEMKKIIQLVKNKNAYLIVDEIYQGLVYDIESSCALTGDDDLDQHIIIINSFSKFFQMTGWRLGWCIVPEHLLQACDHLSQNLFLAAPTTAQKAAMAAFLPETIDILDQRRQIFQQRRDYLYPELLKLGFKIPVKPQGAFYLYCDCSAHTDDSMVFAHELLQTTGLAITPGIDFGSNQPERFVRFSYTRDINYLKQAIQRLKQFLEQ
ncbi:MAG: aminotransferase class I/II-fold pyridoxal phosphate-dependent enzyme [gamma proteobacterium symbiont of Bathyaustriella thionipta]|nr:aminotransferase class I/II-fold pyridoxal phosphate-dependent enzyme [gamma proteobacterium symbiont of Bathyaustriella thionipta]MCU7950044.1 aminotransferase class I/II-fold pyridoxal phosphate-dependent enzyme [gamma proteobacterium symbiont of Bathyaustriella thionipta]MCU7954286.1 aminotransferase class I/II-fold pyridoxal phosphate-dependent enzyme [gamma proteobacterium symbiont of Bathyaustriella thionipta]MCU7956633.1 aminotransferase class I/II-fold pyridoxal phosphate-dependent en